jgi:tRNA pseudouridine55 synthase
MKGSLFVGYKPLFVSSNNYLMRIKREMKADSAGFSGTLDPFATGVLVIATGGLSKLFNYLDLEPKRYKAVLWLGAKSETLDIEGVKEVEEIPPFDIQKIQDAVSALKDVTKIVPPKYSAKRINGKRAYELARANQEVELKECNISVFESTLISYSHPFVTFEVSVSKGTYVRTLGSMVAETLGVCGSLSFLERLSEGKFRYEDKKSLDIKACLNIKENIYKKDKTDIICGKKVNLEDFAIQDDGIYYLDRGDSFSIIEIREQKIIYKLNNIEI